MSELQIVCRELSAREPNPADNRVEAQPYPEEDGKIKGFSLAPRYSLKQLREIERRQITNESSFTTPTRINVKRLSTLTDVRLDTGFDDISKRYHKYGGGIE
jgi:hypothetical protein